MFALVLRLEIFNGHAKLIDGVVPVVVDHDAEGGVDVFH